MRWFSRAKAVTAREAVIPGGPTGKITTREAIADTWTLLTGVSSSILAAPRITDLEVVYGQSSLVFDCVQVIAKVVSKAEITASPRMKTLLERPNISMNWPLFVQHYVAKLMCTGVIFVAKLDSNGLPTEDPDSIDSLQPLKSSGVIYAPGPFTIPYRSMHYADGYNSFNIDKPNTQLIIHMIPSIYDISLPNSPILSCWLEVQTDIARQQYQDKTLVALPKLLAIAETSQPTSKTQRDQLQKSIQQIMGGLCLVLPEGVTMKTPGVIADIPLSEVAQYCEARVCASMGVPPQILGLKAGLEHQSYSNYQEARSGFLVETIYPLLSNMEDNLSRGLGEEIKLVLPESETLIQPLRRETVREEVGGTQGKGVENPETQSRQVT